MGNNDNNTGAGTGTFRRLLSHANYRRQFAVFAGGVALGVFLVIYVWSQKWAYRRTGQGLGIGIFPTIFLGALVVFSILCLIDAYRTGKKSISEQSGQAVSEQDDIDVKWWPVVVLSVAAFVATWAIPRIDPVVLVAILGTFILVFGGIRKWYLVLGTALGLALFVYVFFIWLADIFFPTVWIP